MRIDLASVMVDDQDKALAFYTDKLGFVKKLDIPMGGPRWLTVVSSEKPDGVQLLLEPIGFPPAGLYQKALFDAGIPATSFGVDDVKREYDRLLAAGVAFRSGPTQAGPTVVAMLEDTCGNLIQIHQS
jgi:catechol 2,3-dioxygenase-like lactoylglutathione lyase family enzyme